MENCRLFSERANRGIYESDNSTAKKMSFNIYERLNKNYIFEPED